MKCKTFKLVSCAAVSLMVLAGCGPAPDKTPPVIKIEDEYRFVVAGGRFDPFSGVTAVDDIAGDITKDIVILENDLETDEPGDYTITFSVKDKAGNETTKSRYVEVDHIDLPPSTTPPKASTPQKPPAKAPSNRELSSSKVYYWIQDRYVKYDNLYNNGRDAGDRFTTEVFLDAADYFGATVTEVKKAYDAFRY